MILVGGSATGTAAAVWTNLSRTLTGLGGSALSFSSVPLASIPGNTAVTLRPAATAGTLYTIIGTAASGGNLRFSVTDGSNNMVLAIATANNVASVQFFATNSVWLTITNLDVANPATYMASGITFHQ